jgi:hypothetical protein
MLPLLLPWTVGEVWEGSHPPAGLASFLWEFWHKWSWRFCTAAVRWWVPGGTVAVGEDDGAAEGG